MCGVGSVFLSGLVRDCVCVCVYDMAGVIRSAMCLVRISAVSALFELSIYI